MEHTTGETGTLTCPVTVTNGRVRIAIKIKNMTEGKITADIGGLSDTARTY